MTYQCNICKLQFADPELARKCEIRCATHASCNLEIGRQALNRDAPAVDCDPRFESN